MKPIYLILLLCLSVFGLKSQIRPDYPLYTCYFEKNHVFSLKELKTLASSFDFVYGNEFTTVEMEQTRKYNPDFKFIRYIGNWKADAQYFEDDHYRDMLYYPCAVLDHSIDEKMNTFKLTESPYYNKLELNASTIEGDKSVNSFEYVTWLRIDDELMRIEKWDPEHRTVTVTRNFVHQNIQKHPAKSHVLLPAYGSEPKIKTGDNSRSGYLSYHYDPASTARWDNTYKTLVDFVKKGGDGIWIDILMDGSLRELDMNGNDLPFLLTDGEPRMLSLWNFEMKRPYFRDEFRKKCESGIRRIQERYKKEFGRWPIIYGNNMMASRFEDGNGGHKYYLYPTNEKPRPLDGMCIEDFMGGYHRDQYANWDKKTVIVPAKACYDCYTNYRNWNENVIELMKCSHENLAAMPIIINAGIKTTAFPGLSDSVRHNWELWAYASYLLGVAKQDGKCTTKLGIPMFHNPNSYLQVAVDSIYFLGIGEPVETSPSAELDYYRIQGTNVYQRKFNNGIVLVNPDYKSVTIKLDDVLYDPDTKKKVSSIEMKAQTGKILLQK